MKTEVLDFINDRYLMNEDGQIYDKKKQQYLNMFMARNYLVVKLLCSDTNKWKTFKVATLCAELFVPNPLNERHIGYRDGNPNNIKASNLVWVSSLKELTSKRLTPEERKEIRMKINDAVECEDWQLAQELGSQLDSMEDTGARHQPLKYQPLTMSSKIPAQYSPIVEVTDENGNHLAYGTTKELGELLGVHPSRIIRRYGQPKLARDNMKMEIVALVPKTFANAIIEVYKGDLKVYEGGYTQVCMYYDIHFEDLADLLYSNTNDKALHNGLEFKMKSGQSMIPTDYSVGETDGL